MTERLEPYERIEQKWWALAIRGLAGIAFGLLAVLWPGITLVALVLLFAAYAIVDGVFAIASGIRGRATGRGPDWLLILGGVAGVAAGLIAIVLPGITAIALLVIIAAWAIVTGAAELAAAYALRDEIRGELLLALDGIVSIIFGALLIVFPAAGALAVVWLIGAFAFASGVILLLLAVRLRGRSSSAAPSSSSA